MARLEQRLADPSRASNNVTLPDGRVLTIQELEQVPPLTPPPTRTHPSSLTEHRGLAQSSQENALLLAKLPRPLPDLDRRARLESHRWPIGSDSSPPLPPGDAGFATRTGPRVVLEILGEWGNPRSYLLVRNLRIALGETQSRGTGHAISVLWRPAPPSIANPTQVGLKEGFLEDCRSAGLFLDSTREAPSQTESAERVLEWTAEKHLAQALTMSEVSHRRHIQLPFRQPARI